ncbi:energy-coupling factor transporter transmembrane component T family protein [Salinicoccus albus]|uniref:energy-coupling factor transporter transmembrane component T family protein n=1 Tax=Salinicoccus albus TaxID=418756 RepID=UPI00036E6390|nr:energy-coupling factor transporter transmembrane component T [Salinicoccus albus]
MLDMIKNYTTFIDRTNPVTKLSLGVMIFITVVLMHNPNQLFYLALMLMLTLLLFSGVRIRYLVLLIGVMLAFGLFSSAYMIFYGEGRTTLFSFGIIHVTEESLMRGIHIMMRGLALSFFGALIIFTTRITDVFYSLMQQLRIKPKYAYSFMAAIRMVPIIAREYISLRQARKVRKPLIHKKYVSGITGFKTTIVTLLSQSIRRAWRLSVAMESKGFDDGPRTYYHQTSFSISDFWLVIFTVLLFIFSMIFGTIIEPFATTDAR